MDKRKSRVERLQAGFARMIDVPQERLVEFVAARQKFLQPREHFALTNYYGINCEAKTLQEIATPWGVSRVIPSQLINKACSTLALHSKLGEIPEDVRDRYAAQFFSYELADKLGIDPGIVTKIQNQLRFRHGDVTVRWITEQTRSELMDTPLLGKKSVDAIVRMLETEGLSLATEHPR